MSLTMTDIFCGGGGSSTGGTMVGGVKISMAANHNTLAVNTHHVNHPESDHACVDLHIEEGRVVGLIGPNGAGKTTALNAILGLTTYEGQLNVLGRDPWTQRDQLMGDVADHVPP